MFDDHRVDMDSITEGKLANQKEGRYGLVDKTHPSCVRPGFNTRVQH